jgi:hypothetical protein
MPPSDIEPIFTCAGFSGQQVPFYGLTFTKTGQLKSKDTKSAVLNRIEAEGFTDVIVFSHGWNNEWDRAIDLYKRFLDGIGAIGTEHADKIAAGTKPLMIGISWPSAALVWPWDRAPDLASGGLDDDFDAEAKQHDLNILTDGMDDSETAKFCALVDGKEALSADEVDKLTVLLAPTFDESEPDELDGDSVTAENLAAMLKVKELSVKSTDSEDDEDDDSFTNAGTIGGGAEAAKPAGLFSDVFGLRKVLRLATVRKMKDRAGVVGRGDVAVLVSDILSKPSVRLHLVGHSYGAKVVMSAAVNADTSRDFASALLLQPAINHLAFAVDIGDGRKGGFHSALARFEKPILTTQSRNDFPLTHVFHLAVTRKKDIGEEPDMATLISIYSAMGGFGPSGLPAGAVKRIPIPAKGDAYPGSGAARVVALEGTNKILGHSKVTNDFTFWAMIQNLS